MSRNINDISGLDSLQHSLVVESCVKILVREVLSDRIKNNTSKFTAQTSRNISDQYPLSIVRLTSDKSIGPKCHLYLCLLVLAFSCLILIPWYQLLVSCCWAWSYIPNPPSDICTSCRLRFGI